MFIFGTLESAYLLVLTELFSLGVTAEALQAKIDRKVAISLQRGQFAQKFQVEVVAAHQSFLHG